MRDRRDDGHFNDRSRGKQRRGEKGSRMTFQPLSRGGMYALRVYSNPLAPACKAHVRGRERGAVDQSLARVSLRGSKESTMVFPPPSPPTFLPPPPLSLARTRVRIRIATCAVARGCVHVLYWVCRENRWQDIAPHFELV